MMQVALRIMQMKIDKELIETSNYENTSLNNES
jgi:hypothetical protein